MRLSYIYVRGEIGVSLLLMALTVTASSKQACWVFITKKKRKKWGESCRRDSSKPLYIKKKRKGTYTLRALWPTKREKWVTKKQLPVVAQRMFFFFFFFFLSLIIVRGA